MGIKPVFNNDSLHSLRQVRHDVIDIIGKLHTYLPTYVHNIVVIDMDSVH